MVEPVNYTQTLMCRVAGYCAGRGSKVLIVAIDFVAKEIAQSVDDLKLGGVCDVQDITNIEASPENILVRNPAYSVVLIAAVNVSTMRAAGSLCANYKAAGIPVVAITGWPPPTDSRQFKDKTWSIGNLSVPGMFDLAARYCIGGTKGDILEFGTFQGYTLQCAYHAFNLRNKAANRRFIAFDSFAGIVGTKEGEQFVDGQFSATEESLMFSNFIAGVPEDKVLIVSGSYEVSLREDEKKTRDLLGPTTAAIVHIDCDVEVPAKLALDFVTPYLQQGTLLMFDEYDLNGADNRKGERAALRAWLKENPDFDVEPYRCYHTGARSFLVHRL